MIPMDLWSWTDGAAVAALDFVSIEGVTISNPTLEDVTIDVPTLTNVTLIPDSG